ncbi:MAG: terminase small subunit [Oscillospiraceae bacterium]
MEVEKTQSKEKKSKADFPAFKSAKELQSLVNKYFNSLNGEMLLDENNIPVSDKNGLVYEVPPKPPTLTGLALALGFRGRLSLLKFHGDEKLEEIIETALSRVEEYIEGRLFDKGCTTGAKFSLENNFNWISQEYEDDDELSIDIKVVD